MNGSFGFIVVSIFVGVAFVLAGVQPECTVGTRLEVSYSAGCKCSYPEDRTKRKNILRLLPFKALYCFTNIDEMELSVANTSDEYRRIVGNMCAKRPQDNGCYTQLTMEGEFCLSPVKRHIFKAMKDFYIIGHGVGCQGNGTRFRILLEEFRKSFSKRLEESDWLMQCANVLDGDTRLENYGLTVLHFKTRQYQAMTRFRQCLIDRAAEGNDISNLAQSFVSDMMARMLCLHEDGRYVLCETLDIERQLSLLLPDDLIDSAHARVNVFGAGIGL